MNCQHRVFPSWNRRGGCASKKKARSLRSGADGVVIMVNVDVVTLSGTDHPVCALIKEASQHLLYGAATPPLRGGEHPFPAIDSHLRRGRSHEMFRRIDHPVRAFKG